MSRSLATRPKLKVSREMRVLLILLLMVALIAAWAIWSSNRSAQQALAQTPPTPPSGDAATGEPAGTTPTPPSAAPAPVDGDNVAVQPGGGVDVPSIPAFGEAGTDNTKAAETEPAPTPGGINPDTALATLPGVNPFRPLAVDKDASAPAGQPTPAPPVTQNPVSTPPISLSQPERRPVTPVVNTPSDSTSGVIPIAPIPGTPSRITVDSPATTGGAFPTPTIPGATPAPPRPEPVTVLRPPAARPTPVTLPRASATAARPPAAPTPVRPPVAGVRVPKESIDLSSVVGRGTGAGTPAGAPSTPDGGEGTGATSATALPTPGTPQPITQLGADATAAPVSALDQLIQSREIALNAAVLGPVNTAVFRSRDGFVVVEVGEKLPDSDAVLKAVTADSATLALGNDTKTLQLNER